jgi:hypothetical protein
MNNRELKFRIWYYDQKKFDFNVELKDFSKYSFPLYWCKVQQYTGLKDSQGVEIYEGDIILNDEDKEIVRWGFCGWLCGNESFVGVDIQSIEVVGNIFENPELLKTNE